jgi:hypothetical protein
MVSLNKNSLGVNPERVTSVKADLLRFPSAFVRPFSFLRALGRILGPKCFVCQGEKSRMVMDFTEGKTFSRVHIQVGSFVWSVIDHIEVKGGGCVELIVCPSLGLDHAKLSR